MTSYAGSGPSQGWGQSYVGCSFSSVFYEGGIVGIVTMPPGVGTGGHPTVLCTPSEMETRETHLMVGNPPSSVHLCHLSPNSALPNSPHKVSAQQGDSNPGVCEHLRAIEKVVESTHSGVGVGQLALTEVTDSDSISSALRWDARLVLEESWSY